MLAEEAYEGRVQLQWANKPHTLLIQEDGTYGWVQQDDQRVSEVRLLRNTGTVGDTHPDEDRAKDNLIICGDALDGLKALTDLPEFSDEYQEKVKLIYIDPPFNTKQAFAQYDDNLEHSVWLTMMRDRLDQAKKLLSDSGSIWVHLDDAEMGYCRALMDEVFGRTNFIATVVWRKRADLPNDRPIGTSQDYILVYGNEASFHLRPRPEDQTAYKNPDDDPRGPWDTKDLSANGKGGRFVPSLVYPIVNPVTKEKHYPPNGRCWAYNSDDMAQLMTDGLIVFSKGGKGKPYRKKYLSEVRAGLTWPTLWAEKEFPTGQTGSDEIAALFGKGAFETPKPEGLLERIISIATRRGDVVLDCFAGSGTTAAVAHKMGRRWIAVERSRDTVDTYIAQRLAKVVSGGDPGGITKSVGWAGGGGFRVLEVAPSICTEESGVLVLADEAAGSDLAEAVAAQLGVAYEPDAPFSGRRGQQRLAVVDGYADSWVAGNLIAQLADDESLLLCATALASEIADDINELRRGSEARVIPQDLLQRYASSAFFRLPELDEDDGQARSESEVL
jgi:adenine-specific DNA-methyltransferase